MVLLRSKNRGSKNFSINVTTASSSSSSSIAKDTTEDILNMKKRRVDKKFEKLSSQAGDIDENAETFDERFDSMVHEDEISNLQGDFSKMSWDDSVSPTTTTQADIGQNTPDNDIQDLIAETGEDNASKQPVAREENMVKPSDDFQEQFSFTSTEQLSAELIQTPLNTATQEQLQSTADTLDLLISSGLPTPKPRLTKTMSTDDAIQTSVKGIISQTDIYEEEAVTEGKETDFTEKPAIEDESTIQPVPKPRSQLKHSDSFKSLTALASDGGDDVSLLSIDITEEQSSTCISEGTTTEVSTFTHIKYHRTTCTTASEEPTDPLSEFSESIRSADDMDTEKSEVVDGKGTSFYIGESSRNVIIRSSSIIPASSADLQKEDISFLEEQQHIDKEEEKDSFKEYLTMQKADDYQESKIVRQTSETRNDLLELETETRQDVVTTEEPQGEDTETSSDSGAQDASESLEILDNDQEIDNSIRDSKYNVDYFETAAKTTDESIQSPRQHFEMKEFKEEIPFSTSYKSTVENTSQQIKFPKLDLLLEKSELELSEKEFPKSSGKVVHSPPKSVEEMSKISEKQMAVELLVDQVLEEVQVSLDAAKDELKQVVKDGKLIKESPSEFEFKALPSLLRHEVEKEQLPEKVLEREMKCDEKHDDDGKDKYEQLIEDPKLVVCYASQSLKDAYEQEIQHSMKPVQVKEQHALVNVITTETTVDIMGSLGSDESYFAQKSGETQPLSDFQTTTTKTSTTSDTLSQTFGDINSDQTLKPFDQVIHRVKTESSSEGSTSRWSVPEIDHSSSSDSYYKSLEKSDSRPSSSILDNLLTTQNTSEYQTAMDASIYRESTEFVSAASAFDSSGKTISSHESMKSLDSNLGSTDISELSETLVASSADPDILESEEMDQVIDLCDDNDHDDEEDEDSLIIHSSDLDFHLQQSQMKRSQEMIFKQLAPTTLDEEKADEFETKRSDEMSLSPKENIKEPRMTEEMLLYHSDIRRSIEESRLASSLDEGSILSVSLSSASAIETVVENFEDLIGSAGSSSLTGAEGIGFSRDEDLASVFDETFHMEDISQPQDLGECQLSASSSDELKPKRGHKRSDSTAVSSDVLKNIVDGDSAGEKDVKESESESDHDPYESEYSRAFRSPIDRKKKKKHSTEIVEAGQELEKRSYTPSQLISEVIVEDAITEEIESQKTADIERQPSQNMLDYSNIPDITVTEDVRKPSIDETASQFQDNILYKVKTQEELHKATDVPLHSVPPTSLQEADERFNELVQQQYQQKLAELKRSTMDGYDPSYDDKAPDSPDSFEMVDQPDISDEFVIIEEVAKEANEFDMEGKSISIQSAKFVQKHDEEVEQILIKSAPAAPNLGSQIFRDDMNFEFEESPPLEQIQQEIECGDVAAANKKWVEMQLSENASQLRYPYELASGVLEDIKEEDAEFEVGSSRISSFKDSFSSTPEYDVLAGRRYFSRGENDDISLSSLQEFESLEQAISLENRNKAHQGSTDSSNGSFTRRYTVRHTGTTAGTSAGDDISQSSLKDFEGLENACIEAHLIEIKAKEEAALLLSRSDESNNSNGGDNKNGINAIATTNVDTTITRIEAISAAQKNIASILKSKLEECEESSHKSSEMSNTSLEIETKSKSSGVVEKPESSEHDSADSLEINKSLDLITSSIESLDISKDVTSKSDIDSLEKGAHQAMYDENFDSIENEQMDSIPLWASTSTVCRGGTLESITTTTSSTETDSSQQAMTQTTKSTTVTVITSSQNEPRSLDLSKDTSTDSLNIYMDQTSSTGTNATYQREGDSQMTGSMTSCASSTLMEDSYPDTATSNWPYDDTPTGITNVQSSTQETRKDKH